MKHALSKFGVLTVVAVLLWAAGRREVSASVGETNAAVTVAANQADDPVLVMWYHEGGPQRRRTNAPPNLGLLVAAWADGRIVWSQDLQRGEAGCWTARLATNQIQALLERFATEGVFEASLSHQASYPPDSDFTALYLRHGGQRLCWRSAHEIFEKRPNLVALSTGVTVLKADQTRAEALRQDKPEYQRFRRHWTSLRQAITALVPEKGEPFTTPLHLDRAIIFGR